MIDPRSKIPALPPATLLPRLIIELAVLCEPIDVDSMAVTVGPAPVNGAMRDAECLPAADLRELLKLGYIERRIDGRLVLSEAGRRLMADCPSLSAVRAMLSPPPHPAVAWPPIPRLLERELWWHGRLVKEFPVPAPSQLKILTAYEEDGWPSRIDDPLERKAGADHAERLHRAVAGLNGNQVNHFLRFKRDGASEGIFWSLTKKAKKLILPT